MTHAHRVSWFLFTSLLLVVPCLGVLAPTLIATESAHAQTFSTLYTFTGGSDGANPSAGLVRDAAGNLYGTTAWGGAYGYGVVFKLTP
jgi:uncharacterized repeat protein (TIGR03803 family)